MYIHFDYISLLAWISAVSPRVANTLSERAEKAAEIQDNSFVKWLNFKNIIAWTTFLPGSNYEPILNVCVIFLLNWKNPFTLKERGEFYK